MDRYYRETHANVHRGVHTLSEEATAQYESAGQGFQVHRCMLRQGSISTRNATEAINLVAYSWARGTQAGRSGAAHRDGASRETGSWQILAAEKGIELDFVRVADNGTLILDELPKLLTARTKLFGFTAASNVLGTLDPVNN